ncbi:MAG: HlyD family efflux transporter periplasmic adaptor subunit [Woeseiaceae bacterium]
MLTDQRPRTLVAGADSPEVHSGTLLRKQSVSAARHRLLGRVCILTPPTAGATLLVALSSLILLGVVVYTVEVPQRTRAIGVLMPAGGLLKVIANGTGRITELAVKEGMTVREGQVLLRITSDRNAPGRSPVSESQVRSLRMELELMERAQARQRDMKSSRVTALEEQFTLTRSRQAKARVEIKLQASHIGLLKQRYKRMKVLAANGGLAKDLLSQERSGILHAKAISAGLEGDLLQIGQELADLQAKRDETLAAAGLDRLQHDMGRERLLRQIGRAEIEAGRVVLAPAAGIVARLSVTTGSTSRPGQTLMTLYKAEGRLEAWLYLPSDKAGQLKAGQSVQLRLDAYPHEMFGTLTAVVSKVSTIALLASDLTVPLPIKGPVFEVRASIRDDRIEALGSSWPLAPGTSFRADVIRRRYRLYQWLLRSFWSDDDGTAFAGA